MGLLFNRGDSEDGCGQHHWGEYHTEWEHPFTSLNVVATTLRQPAGNYEAGDRIVLVEVKPEEVAQCQHDGCSATDTRPGQTFTAPMDAFATQGISDVLEALGGIHDDDE